MKKRKRGFVPAERDGRHVVTAPEFVDVALATARKLEAEGRLGLEPPWASCTRWLDSSSECVCELCRMPRSVSVELLKRKLVVSGGFLSWKDFRRS